MNDGTSEDGFQKFRQRLEAGRCISGLERPGWPEAQLDASKLDGIP
jgi:hypothetical protein